MHISVLGLDVGHGFTKWAFRDGTGRIRTGSFRSVALPHIDSTLAISLRRAQASSSIKTIAVDGQLFDVDVDENSRVGKALGERNEANDFAGRPEYRALLGATLAYLDATHVSTLVLGLPVHTFARYAETLQKTFRGMLSFGGRSVLVDRVVVVPQPVGSLLTVVAQGDASLVETTICLVDIGHYSADWIVSSQGFTIQFDRSGGRPGGASHIYRAIAEALSGELEEPFEGVDAIELALRNGTPLLAFGQAVDITRYVERGKAQAVETARALRAKVRSAEDLTLVLTGGGGPLYRDALAMVFPRNRLIELAQGRLTNSIGFVLFGEQHRS
ncbi:hypothetical protein PTE30175_03535 [Pandoraea terrae]|uniref:Actin-like protein N-terminal domain-containing protein n=1 Tax=Pandoraea terrae TaxID=1537710 RepID=A0A5E4X351_9BURK|nr:hypothetical protein [Pandoraea terrae]VVE30635.1 hypothetical protein PTE30175_03535 [Pandoraea terrae]